MSEIPKGQDLLRPQILLGTKESNSDTLLHRKILRYLFTGLLVYSTLLDYNEETKPSSAQVMIQNDSSSCFLSLTFFSVLIFCLVWFAFNEVEEPFR